MIMKEKYVDDIEQLLSWLATYINGKNINSRTDVNHAAEDFYANLLNLVYGFSLKNGNNTERNLPAIDLVDEKNCIAIQVTSDNSISKVRETLLKFQEKKYKNQPYSAVFRKLVILIVTTKGNHDWKRVTLPSVKAKFDPNKDIWDYSDIISDLRSDSFSINDLKNIKDFLRENLSFTISLEDKASDQFEPEIEDEIESEPSKKKKVIIDNWDKPIRRLAHDLWINWKTGCLAADTKSVETKHISKSDQTTHLPLFLTPSQLRLLSVLVQGEGAVVSWREMYKRGMVTQKAIERIQKSARYGRENDKIIISDERSVKSIVEKAKASVEELCQIINAHAEIIKPAENGKGYRIELYRANIGGGTVGSLFSEEVRKNDWNCLLSGYNKTGPYSDTAAWIRSYYAKECESFEGNVTNAGSGDEGSEAFGNYKMIEAYMNAYASEEGDVHTMAMLDYVEAWHHSNNDTYGKVLVLHGQPGDGKTTFCKKAVYAHRFEGWLQEAPNVIRISLNPNDSREIISEESKRLTLSNVLCFFDDSLEDKRFFCNPLELKKGTLLILDGYDERFDKLIDVKGVSTFHEFYKKVRDYAGRRKWNIIITSRSMCIEQELKENSDIRRASFARMETEQQNMMIDRMIELDSDKKCSTEDFSDVDDLRKYQEATLPKLRNNKRLNELLVIPALFRMVVACRFEDIEQITSEAELYTRLFHSLMTIHKKVSDAETKVLFREYEKIAAQIFNYNNDTCLFGAEPKEKKLIYLFFTKNDQSGQMGFLHGAFRQFFLARYIVSELQEAASEIKKRDNGKKSTTAINREECNTGITQTVFKSLFLNLRARRNLEPFVWQLVAEIAEMKGVPGRDPFAKNVDLNECYAEKQVTIEDIKRVLAELDNDLVYSNCFSGDNIYPYGLNAEKNRILGTENAFFNLINALVAVEKGCLRRMYLENGYGTAEDFQAKRKSHDKWVTFRWKLSVLYGGEKGYNNICELLRRGIFTDINLEGANLSNCRLSNVRIENAVMLETLLENAEFSSAHLERVEMSGSNLSGANFSNAFLYCANLCDVKQNKTIYTEKNLCDTNRKLSDILLDDDKSSDYRESTLLKLLELLKDNDFNVTDYDKTSHSIGMSKRFNNARNELKHVTKMTIFKNAILIKAKLRGAHLEGADFSGADLTGADLSGAFLTNSIFYRAMLKDANLSEAHLEGVVLRGAILERATLKQAHLEGAVLDGALLDGAILIGASFEGTSLIEASVKYAYFDVPYFGNEKICSGVSQSGFWFDEFREPVVGVNGAILDRAILKGADFEGAFLSIDQYLYAKSNLALSLPLSIPEGIMELPDDLSDKEISDLNRTVQIKGHMMIDMRVANTIYFGHFYQDKVEGKSINVELAEAENQEQGGMLQPLKWRVLRREYDKVLLITDKMVERRCYNEARTDVTWELCSLRKWLNEDFLLTCFNEKERAKIVKVCNQNPDNKRYATKGGNPTWDRVFILSISEAEAYFRTDDERKATATPRAGMEIRNRVSDRHKTLDGDVAGWWWLRSPGYSGSYAAHVGRSGGIGKRNTNVDHPDICVRPALWIRL